MNQEKWELRAISHSSELKIWSLTISITHEILFLRGLYSSAEDATVVL